jgi:hypothetical protein
MEADKNEFALSRNKNTLTGFNVPNSCIENT